MVLSASDSHIVSNNLFVNGALRFDAFLQFDDLDNMIIPWHWAAAILFFQFSDVATVSTIHKRKEPRKQLL
jgi:hypothetical protein